MNSSEDSASKQPQQQTNEAPLANGMENNSNGSQHQPPVDPIVKSTTNSANLTANGIALESTPASSLATNGNRRSSNKNNAEKKKSTSSFPAVQQMQLNLRDLVRKPPPPQRMPPTAAGRNEIAAQKRVSLDMALMALNFLAERPQQQMGPRMAEGEYQIVCHLHSINSVMTGGPGITVEHADGPFNEADKKFSSAKFNDLLHQAFAKLEGTGRNIKEIEAPAPMNMIGLLRICLDHPDLDLEPPEAMYIARKLHEKNYISNPITLATEFQQGFPNEEYMQDVIRQMDEIGGEESRIDSRSFLSVFSGRMDSGGKKMGGTKAGNAHEEEPIYPLILKALNINKKRSLEGKEKAMYLIICRHFLATFHENGQIGEYTNRFIIGQERFNYEYKVLEMPGFTQLTPWKVEKEWLPKKPDDLKDEKITKFTIKSKEDVKRRSAVDFEPKMPTATQSEFIGLLAEKRVCVRQIPEIWKTLIAEGMVTTIGRNILPSSKGHKMLDEYRREKAFEGNNVFGDPIQLEEDGNGQFEEGNGNERVDEFGADNSDEDSIVEEAKRLEGQKRGGRRNEEAQMEEGDNYGEDGAADQNNGMDYAEGNYGRQDRTPRRQPQSILRNNISRPNQRPQNSTENVDAVEDAPPNPMHSRSRSQQKKVQFNTPPSAMHLRSRSQTLEPSTNLTNRNGQQNDGQSNAQLPPNLVDQIGRVFTAAIESLMDGHGRNAAAAANGNGDNRNNHRFFNGAASNSQNAASNGRSHFQQQHSELIRRKRPFEEYSPRDGNGQQQWASSGNEWNGRLRNNAGQQNRQNWQEQSEGSRNNNYVHSPPVNYSIPPPRPQQQWQQGGTRRWDNNGHQNNSNNHFRCPPMNVHSPPMQQQQQGPLTRSRARAAFDGQNGNEGQQRNWNSNGRHREGGRAQNWNGANGGGQNRNNYEGGRNGNGGAGGIWNGRSIEQNNRTSWGSAPVQQQHKKLQRMFSEFPAALNPANHYTPHRTGGNAHPLVAPNSAPPVVRFGQNQAFNPSRANEEPMPIKRPYFGRGEQQMNSPLQPAATATARNNRQRNEGGFNSRSNQEPKQFAPVSFFPRS